MQIFPQNIFFLGAGGIGMSALVRYFIQQGHHVSGYDKTPSALTQKLQAEGAEIFFNDHQQYITSNYTPQNTLVVFTPAIPQDNQLKIYFDTNEFPLMKRAEVLGTITQNKVNIAVAGTHGKTTISSMIASCLYHQKISFTAFLGGIANNFNNNFYHKTNSEVTVIEADEFDRSFLQLHPDYLVISAMDADHLDIYGNVAALHHSFNTLVNEKLKKNGKVLAHKSVAHLLKQNVLTYAINDETADFTVINVQVINHNFVADFKFGTTLIPKVTIGLPGIHNLENSLACFGILSLWGMDAHQITQGISAYQGVARRFEIKLKTVNQVYIDDYAHHPEEINQLIKSVKILYPQQKICGIFQPHLFSRTRDFLSEFATALSALDELILLDIYPARELPIEGVNSATLLAQVSTKLKILCSKKEALTHLTQSNCNVVLSIGAGDIGVESEKYRTVLQQKWYN